MERREFFKTMGLVGVATAVFPSDDKRAKWLEIADKLNKEMYETLQLGWDYEDLRAKLVVKGDDYGPPEVVKQMRDIEAKKEEIWRSHRELVGACPKCKGTREPGSMPEGFGFGCMMCHDFEVFGRGEAPGDPRKAETHS